MTGCAGLVPRGAPHPPQASRVARLLAAHCPQIQSAPAFASASWAASVMTGASSVR
jgi:hypothetical protein